MPTKAKGARLWLRPPSGHEKGSVWLIKDGKRRISTGRGAGERDAAERDLAQYLADKYEPERDRARRPSQIAVEDAINVYSADVGVKVRRPKELAQRFDALLDFWASKTFADVTGAECRKYTEKRGSESMARRELEDLRAAVNHYVAEGYCEIAPKITL